MTKVLIVDDEKRMLDLIALYLRPHKYSCTKAQGAFEALEYLQIERFDIVLLDIMMPEMDGWELCEKIRTFSDVPIIMLTARDQHEDIVKGLKLGADDYIAKPFNEGELLARMEALLRRQPTKKQIDMNGLTWDLEQFKLTYEGQVIELTPKEFLMLGHFLQHPNQVFSRDHLIELIWSYDANIETRTVDSHVRNMRDKIRKANFPVDDYFKTVWGIGYKWINSS